MNPNDIIIASGTPAFEGYDSSLDWYEKDFFKEYGVYVKPQSYALSSRKLDTLLQISELQRYYQCNPVKFIDDIFGIDLLDSQALAIQRSWICPNVLITATRGWENLPLSTLD